VKYRKQKESSTANVIDVAQLSDTWYSKTPLLRPPLDLRKSGLYIGVVLLLS